MSSKVPFRIGWNKKCFKRKRLKFSENRFVRQILHMQGHENDKLFEFCKTFNSPWVNFSKIVPIILTNNII